VRTSRSRRARMPPAILAAGKLKGS